MKFPKNLKKIRIQKKVSQQKLAKSLGVVQSCIANWESGIRNPRLTDIIKLSKHLKVSITQLTGSFNMNNLTLFNNQTSPSNKMPLYSSCVSAGFPSPADDYVENRLDLNDLLIDNPTSTFFVKVSGESMIDAGINDGDILIVDKSKKISNNNIVIAVLDGELTVKRIQKDKTSLVLVAQNKAFKNIQVTKESDFTVWGVVTNVIHKL